MDPQEFARRLERVSRLLLLADARGDRVTFLIQWTQLRSLLTMRNGR